MHFLFPFLISYRVQLATGQTLAVTGRVRVPQFANSNMLSVLSVIVQRRTDSAISQRKIYIRTRSEVILRQNKINYLI